MIKILPPEIEEKLSLANTYKILNSQLDLLLSEKERAFLIRDFLSLIDYYKFCLNGVDMQSYHIDQRPIGWTDNC